MDPIMFYGRKNKGVAFIPPENESEDENLSDDDSRDDKVSHERVDDNIIINEDYDDKDEYDSEDDIPLARLFQQSSAATKQNLKKDIVWKDDYLQTVPEDITFLGDCTLPEVIKSLDTPLDYFRFLFPKAVIDHIVQQSLLYSVQQRPEKPIKVDKNDIEQFIGLSIFMSLIRLPATRDYWSPGLGHPKISEVMSVNRFEELKRFIHFNDNSTYIDRGEPGYDRLHKIRPLLSMVKERLLLVPQEEKLCVDEQIVPFKGRINIKQYNPKKPHKWGYKVFVLSGVSGFSYDLEVFTGASDNVCINDEPDLGVSSNVVMRMARSIPRHQNYHLYFDNWFSSLQLQVYLFKAGILALGTVRRNRLGRCELPSEKDLRGRGRGSYVEKVGTIDGVDLAVTAWYDNKVVHLLSSFVGSQPEGEVQRYFVSEKKHKMIPCPKVVQVYNQHMGGVDLLDSILGYYRIKIRSKKWYLRIFFHLLDLTVVNAWLLYRRSSGLKMPLKEFKASVAEGLIKQGKVVVRKRGRPSSDIENLITIKKTRGPIAVLPNIEVRQDNIGHLPVWVQIRQRCKLPNCKGFTYVSCEKCNVALCFNKNKNCYKSFHSN